MIGLVGFLVEALVSEAAPTSLVARNRVPTPSSLLLPYIYQAKSRSGDWRRWCSVADPVEGSAPQPTAQHHQLHSRGGPGRSSCLSSRRPVLEEGKLRGGRRDSLRRTSSKGLCIPYDEASQKRIRPLDLRAQGELTLAAASSEKQRKERAARARRSEDHIRL